MNEQRTENDQTDFRPCKLKVSFQAHASCQKSASIHPQMDERD